MRSEVTVVGLFVCLSFTTLPSMLLVCKLNVRYLHVSNGVF